MELPSFAALSGAQRAAAFLIALGVEDASPVLARLSDYEMEQITREVARLQRVSSDLVRESFETYHFDRAAAARTALGGPTFARDALTKAVGESRAVRILERAAPGVEPVHRDVLRNTQPKRIARFLEQETPQTAALVLAYLSPDRAAELIGLLPEDTRSEAVRRLAVMDPASRDTLDDLEAALADYLASVDSADAQPAGGVEHVAGVLSAAQRTTERSVLDALDEHDPDLAAAIRGYLFTFDDLRDLDARTLQRVLAEVNQRDLALALKAAPEDLAELILGGVSQRVADTVREELELMGPVRIREVDEAQQRIVEVALDLDERGEIALRQPNEEMV